MTRVEDPANPLLALAGTPLLYADQDYALLIEREIPLYHASQTEDAHLHPRTLAYMAYEEIFYDMARKDSYVRWDYTKENLLGCIGGWITVKTADTTAGEYWQKGLLAWKHIRHTLPAEIIGVKATEKTRFVAIDHDFHGKDLNDFCGSGRGLARHLPQSWDLALPSGQG